MLKNGENFRRGAEWLTRRRKEVVATLATGALVLSGCSVGANESSESPTPTPPSTSATETYVDVDQPLTAEAVAATIEQGDGIWIAPGAVRLPDSDVAVRPVAETDGDWSCSPSEFLNTKYVNPEDLTIYTYNSKSGKFVNDGAMTSKKEDYYSRDAAMNKPGIVQCINFEPKDEYDENGVPVVGVLPDGQRYPFFHKSTGAEDLASTLEPGFDLE